jgi:hypothetical protein
LALKRDRLERLRSLLNRLVTETWTEANIGPKRCLQTRTVSWLVSTPHSCSRSSTFRN